FYMKNKELNKLKRKLDTTLSLSNNISEKMYDLIHICALLFIGLAAIKGSLTPGTIVTFSLLFELVIWPVTGLSHQWNRLYEGVGAFQRIYELFTFKTQQHDDK